MRGNTPSKQRSKQIIDAVYEYLKEHGETTSEELASNIGCCAASVGSPQLAMFNIRQREEKRPHVFRVHATNGKIKTSWRLIER